MKVKDVVFVLLEIFKGVLLSVLFHASLNAEQRAPVVFPDLITELTKGKKIIVVCVPLSTKTSLQIQFYYIL